MYSSTKSTKKNYKLKKYKKVVGTNGEKKWTKGKYQIYLESVVLHLRDVCILVLRRTNIYRTDKNY